MIKVIINADDLGLNEMVNSQIELALKNHWITSSTILANTNYWEHIIKIVKKFPKASFGIHLNLTEGISLTNSSILKKYGIINEDGYFTRKIHSIKNFTPELKEAIFIELSSQFELIKIKGIKISHIDGHHHCHTIKGLEDIVLKLALKYNIEKIRNQYYWPLSNPFFKHDYRWKIFIKNNSLISTTYFNAYKSAFLKIKKFPIIHSFLMNNLTVELMCHPGHPSFINEMQLIKTFSLEKYLKNIKYINYSNL